MYPPGETYTYLRIIAECLLILINTWYVILELIQFRTLRLDYFRSKSNWLDISYLTLMYVMIPLRIFRTHEEPVLAFLAILLWLKLILFSRGFPQTGIFVRMIGAIIKKIFFFLVVLFLTIIAYSHGFYLIHIAGYFDPQLNYDTFPHALITQYQMLLGQFDVSQLYSLMNYVQFIAIFFWVTFSLIIVIILLNLLIALMSNAYEQVEQNAAEEWMVELADILVDIQDFSLLPWEKRGYSEWFPKWIHCIVPTSVVEVENKEKEEDVEKRLLDKLKTELLQQLELKINTVRQDISKQVDYNKHQFAEIKHLFSAKNNSRVCHYRIDGMVGNG